MAAGVIALTRQQYLSQYSNLYRDIASILKRLGLSKEQYYQPVSDFENIHLGHTFFTRIEEG